MKVFKLSSLAAAGAAIFLLASCDSTNVPQEVSDATINNAVASSSGDALATSLSDMLANESNVSLAIKAPMPMASATGSGAALTYTRTRTCYNASDATVACGQIAQVRKVITHVTANGTRTGSSTTEGGATINWTGAAHRTADDTLVRNFNTAQPPVEQSRTHTALGVAHDTATFTDDVSTRVVSEAAVDSVRGVTWNLPHTQNPWPVSGKIVRVDTVDVVATTADQTFTRTVVRVVEVDFPPDAQGNVVLKVNSVTCNLNLATHAVTACH